MHWQGALKQKKKKKSLKAVKRKTMTTCKHILSHFLVGDQTYGYVIFLVITAKHK
jgi:hypothetical protein